MPGASYVGSTANVLIGAVQGPGSFYASTLDDLRFYNQVNRAIIPHLASRRGIAYDIMPRSIAKPNVFIPSNQAPQVFTTGVIG
jgi:hypothetical protein